jgi:hypothetical protein
MKTNFAAALAFSSTLFALTGESEESKVKERNAKPAVGRYDVRPIFSTHGPSIPRVSILDQPIRMKIEVVPLINSEHPVEVSFEWRK